jgi:hypothetical protein
MGVDARSVLFWFLGVASKTNGCGAVEKNILYFE